MITIRQDEYRDILEACYEVYDDGGGPLEILNLVLAGLNINVLIPQQRDLSADDSEEH